MKKIYRGRMFLIGAVMILAACSSGQDDMDLSQNPGGAEEMVEYSFTESNADSKASVTDKMQTAWDEGDKVTVWIGDSKDNVKPYVFETEKGGTDGAAFHAMVPKSVNSLCYYAFYPETTQNVETGKLTFSIPTDGTVRQKEANNSKHLAEYRAMYAPVVNRTVSSTLLTGVHFRQLTSLLVFDIMNMRKNVIDVSEVVVMASKPVFYEEAAIEPGTEEVTVEQTGDPVNSVALSLGDTDNGVKLEAQNGRMIAYMPIVPSASLQGVNIKLILKVNGQEMASLVVSAEDLMAARVTSFEREKFYMFYLDVLTSEIYWDANKSIADWENGGVIDIPV